MEHGTPQKSPWILVMIWAAIRQIGVCHQQWFTTLFLQEEQMLSLAQIINLSMNFDIQSCHLQYWHLWLWAYLALRLLVTDLECQGWCGEGWHIFAVYVGLTYFRFKMSSSEKNHQHDPCTIFELNKGWYGESKKTLTILLILGRAERYLIL